jgi:lipid-A-disaccharide synthase
LEPTRTWIALLPGSRPKEIHSNLPELLEAARNLNDWGLTEHHDIGGFEYVLPLARTLNAEQRAEVQDTIENLGQGLNIQLVEDARAALFHARVSVVASGTATVEAALIGNPFVVVYRVSPITYAIAKRVVKVPHVAMANLIAGKRVVPELIQHDFTATKIVQQLEQLLPDGEPRQSMMQELKAIRELLNARLPNRELESQGPGRQVPFDGVERGGAIDRVAAITLDQLEIQPERPGTTGQAPTEEIVHP